PPRRLPSRAGGDAGTRPPHRAGASRNRYAAFGTACAHRFASRFGDDAVTAYKVHVSGLGFLEGPVVLPSGEIAFVDLTQAKIRAYKDGEYREICSVSGAPNGMRLGPDGALYICNNGGIGPIAPGQLHRADPEISGRLQRVTQDGTVGDF